MNDDQVPDPPRNPFPNAARRAGAKLEPIAKLTAAVAALPPPARTIAVGESIRPLATTADELPDTFVVQLHHSLDGPSAMAGATTASSPVSEHWARPLIGDELGPLRDRAGLDDEIRAMTDDLERRAAHRGAVLDLEISRVTVARQAVRIRDLEAQLTEQRARDVSIVGAVVRKLLRGDR